MPFSDPMADGPVIQRATERALAQGVGLRRRARRSCATFAQRDDDDAGRADGLCQPDRGDGRRGASRDRARDAGVDGVLVVDYPPEECAEFAAAAAGARHRPDLPARADDDRRAHRRASRAARARLRLLRVAEGRHRRRASRHRRASRQDCRDPPPRRSCRSASASASATRRARRRSPSVADAVVIGSRADPGDRSRRRASAPPTRPERCSRGIRSALDAMRDQRGA